MARPTIEPVDEAALPAFARFLHENLARERTPAEWEAALRTNWMDERPNFGFALWSDGQIVGGIGALYAQRQIDGREERTCNITSWCVLEAFRQQSMRLAMAVINQPGLSFTDFSPTKVVGSTLQFFRFQPIEVEQLVVPNLPGPGLLGAKLLHRAADIESALEGAALKAWRDHAGFPWLRHALVGEPGAWCHIVYKRQRFKHLPAAAVLHVSNPALLARHWGRLAAHLLSRGLMLTLLEQRMISTPPRPSRLRTGFNAKLFLSPTLQAQQIDYLYSESVAMDL